MNPHTECNTILLIGKTIENEQLYFLNKAKVVIKCIIRLSSFSDMLFEFMFCRPLIMPTNIGRSKRCQHLGLSLSKIVVQVSSFV